MPISIDSHSFRKDGPERPQRWGYQTRGSKAPTSIVIHTTNNKHRDTSFINEATYLRDSSKVSAHFIVAKDGRCVQFLDAYQWQAWHAGEALTAFSNAKSIGIELHVSVGERPAPAQLHALTELVRLLMARFDIAPPMVETHRKVALPEGRKTDPEGWDNAAFYAWRDALGPRTYRVRGVPIYEQETCIGPIAGWLDQGAIVDVDKDEGGGVKHLASGVGFVRDALDAV